MKTYKAILHTLRFMWLGRFGGSISDGDYYLLWTVNIHKSADVSLSNLTLNKLHNGNLFKVHTSRHNIDIKNSKWITR